MWFLQIKYCKKIEFYASFPNELTSQGLGNNRFRSTFSLQ